MKAIVIGCGRVGSSIAHQLHGEGWDVVAVDEKEEALSRLGESWDGGFVVGHGMDTSVLRRAGIEDADAVVVSTDGDNTNIVVGQVVQKRFGIECVVVRLLDPGRAAFYASQGMRTVCPTSNAIEGLVETVRDLRRAQSGRRRPDVPPDRRRGQDRREPRPQPAPGRPRGDADRAAARPVSSGWRTSSSTSSIQGDATEILILERAGIQRPPSIVVAVTGDDEDNIVICQLAREKYGVEKVIARVNDPRNQVHFDLLGVSPTVCATSSIMALIEHEVPEHGLVHLLELPEGERRDRRGADPARTPTAPVCRSTGSSFPKAPA